MPHGAASGAPAWRARRNLGAWLLPCGLVGGSLAALQFTTLPPSWALCAMALSGALCLVTAPTRPLAALLLACSWSLWNFQHRLEERLPGELAGRVFDVSGTVVSMPQEFAGYASFRFRPDRTADGTALPPLVLVRWYRRWPELRAGQRWRLELRMKPPWAKVNFQGPDRERWYFASGIGAVASVRDGARVRSTAPATPSIEVWRERIFREIARQVPDPRRQGLLQALAVADRSGIDRQDRNLLIQTGTAHLLAISGLHIGLAAAGGVGLVRGMTWILPLAGTGRLLHFVLAAGGLLAATAYAALAGFGTSTLRALVMLLALMAAALTTRSLHPARAWLLALCAVLLVDPFAPLGAGFWFSFLAVAALLLQFAPRIRARSAWRTLLMAQAAVMLVMLPVSAAWFQCFSLVGYAANLVAIPLVSLAVVPLVLAGNALLGVSADLAGLPWSAAGWAVSVLLRMLEALASRQGAPLALAQPALPTALAALVGAFLLLLPRGLPGRWTGILLILPLFLPAKRASSSGAIELEILDAGQGTAVLLTTGDRVLLYDSGPGDGGEANLVGSVIAPAVMRGGPPERILVSHGDLDHAGGLRALVNQYPEAEVRANLPRGFGGGREDLEAIRPCTAPLSWTWGEVRFEVLHPSPALPYLGNDSSCVLALEGPGGRVLLSGDVSAAVERRLLHARARPYDLLLVPHHGSTTSSSPEFVAATRPRAAVATAALGNRFGFPRDEVRRRYERAGARFWSTGECGALRLRLLPDGRFEARSARRDRPGIWRWPAAPGCPGKAAEP